MTLSGGNVGITPQIFAISWDGWSKRRYDEGRLSLKLSRICFGNVYDALENRAVNVSWTHGQIANMNMKGNWCTLIHEISSCLSCLDDSRLGRSTVDMNRPHSHGFLFLQSRRVHRICLFLSGALLAHSSQVIPPAGLASGSNSIQFASATVFIVTRPQPFVAHWQMHKWKSEYCLGFF